MPKNCLLSEDEIKELKLNVKSYNSNLIDVLVKQTLIKKIQKNYKAQAVKRVWIEKENSLDGRPLGIPTLRDRILQKIIWMSIFPIAEFQADTFSFAYRPLRSAVMCISILYNRCVQAQNFLRKKYFFNLKINRCVSLKFFGKKCKKRRKLNKKKLYILNQKSKRFLSKKTFKRSKCMTI